MLTTVDFKATHGLSDSAFKRAVKAVCVRSSLEREAVVIQRDPQTWEVLRPDLLEEYLATRPKRTTTGVSPKVESTSIQRWSTPVEVPETAITVQHFDSSMGQWLATAHADTVVELAKHGQAMTEIQYAIEAVQIERRKSELEEQRLEEAKRQERLALVRLEAEYELLEEQKIRAEVRGKTFTAQARLDELAKALGRVPS